MKTIEQLQNENAALRTMVAGLCRVASAYEKATRETWPDRSKAPFEFREAYYKGQEFLGGIVMTPDKIGVYKP